MVPGEGEKTNPLVCVFIPGLLERLLGVVGTGDGEMGAGRNSLQVALASLRRQLEPPGIPLGSVLRADRSVVRLNPIAYQTDVARFEAALKAAARSASPEKKREALDQATALFRDELLPGFYDDWIVEERERLNALGEEARHRREGLPPVPAEAVPPALVEPGSAAALPGFPLPFTRFFGREHECAQAAECLCSPQTRLVTLTGPGGAGKTRLAGEVAHAVRDAFSGPIVFVSLVDLTDASLIPGAIAAALGLTPSADAEPRDQVVMTLAGQPPALLVLDNFEHLVEGGAPLALSLLTRLPTLTCLVTSRRRLALPGEHECPVPPLPLPDDQGTPEQIARAASAQIFVDRAQAARPDFQLTRGNASAVARLCCHLEGLPLAIELVAARAGAMTPAQMAERLGQRFELLTSRRGDKGNRHRSLWVALAWSHDLLPPHLQRFFARLSVFRGGGAIEAAQAVCEEAQALEMLTQLRERSLITLQESGAQMRFRLLETLREFGAEHLSARERQTLDRRHASYFQHLAAQMETRASGPGQNRALETLDADLDNLRAALAFCRADTPGDGWDGGETGLCLAGALGHYWTARGLLREGSGWLEGALAGEGSAEARSKALAEAGWMAAGMGDYDKAQAALTDALTLCRDRNDPSALAATLRKRGVAFLWQGENARAVVDLEESLALSRALGDDAGVARALNSLGVLAEQWREDKAGARCLYEEALTFFRKCGDQRWESYCLHDLGNIAHDFGDHDRAETLLRAGLALTEALGDLWQRAYCLRSLGDVAEARGDLAEAILLLEEGRDLCRRLGDRMSEAGTLCSLASVARRQSDAAQAQALYGAALRLYRDMGHPHGAGLCLLSLAEVSLSCHQWPRAIRQLTAARNVCRGITLAHDTLTRLETAQQEARAALGSEAFGSVWEEERRPSWEEVVEAVLQETG